MGAIAGLVYANGRAVLDEELERLGAAGASRAVDGVARWAAGPAGFVRFRHATTAEASLERQPCPSAGSGWVICFDGRLDNRAALLDRLGARGAALRPRPDEEIALALFEAEGEAFLRHVTGDYALAIWMPEQQRLFCARGPVGFRPFYYVADAQHLAFATEPRTLLLGRGLERRINEGMVAEHLTQRLVTREESLWHGISRLPQGAALEFRQGALRVWQWDDAPHDDWSRVSEGAHVERFRDLFDQALIATTRARTPVVAQLSGGLDSSSVFCRATELQRTGRIVAPLSAITARFPGEATDESAWSGMVETKLGVTADVVSGHRFHLDEAAQWTAATLQFPLRPNTVNTLQAVFRRLSETGARVLLSGEGGDEFLNGTHAHWIDELRRGRIDLIVREGLAQQGKSGLASVRDLLHGTLGPLLRPNLYQAIALRRGWMGEPVPDWVDRHWLERVGLAERIAQSRAPVRLPSLAAQNRYAIVEGYGLSFAMEAVNAYAEQLGVEYRHPFYDRDLVRFYLGASGAVLFRHGVRRHVLREAMRGTLPEPIRTRCTKAIFNAQTLDGLAIFFEQRPIADLAPVRLGWVDPVRLRAIWDRFWHWRTTDPGAPLPQLPFGALWQTAALDLWLTHAARV